MVVENVQAKVKEQTKRIEETEKAVDGLRKDLEAGGGRKDQLLF